MNSKPRFLPDPETGCLSDESTKKYFSRFGLSVFVMCTASFLVPIVVGYLLNTFAPQLFESKELLVITNTALSILTLYGVALPIFLLMTKSLPKIKPTKEKMGFLKWLGGFCIAFLAMMTGNYISNMLIIAIESLSGTTLVNPIESAIEQGIVPIIYICLIAPVLEEIFFRKIVCDRLLPLGEGYAVFVSAVLFGLIHQNFYQFAYAFFVGLIFAFIYVKTGKLIYSMLYHVIINILGSVVAPFIIKQVDIDRLLTMLETGVFDYDLKMIIFMLILLAYEGVMMIVGIIGIVLLIKAKYDKKLKLEAGIIPPPKKHRIANIFCTAGVAAAVAYFAFAFVLSIIPS